MSMNQKDFMRMEHDAQKQYNEKVRTQEEQEYEKKFQHFIGVKKEWEKTATRWEAETEHTPVEDFYFKMDFRISDELGKYKQLFTSFLTEKMVLMMADSIFRSLERNGEKASDLFDRQISDQMAEDILAGEEKNGFETLAGKMTEPYWHWIEFDCEFRGTSDEFREKLESLIGWIMGARVGVTAIWGMSFKKYKRKKNRWRGSLSLEVKVPVSDFSAEEYLRYKRAITREEKKLMNENFADIVITDEGFKAWHKII